MDNKIKILNFRHFNVFNINKITLHSCLVNLCFQTMCTVANYLLLSNFLIFLFICPAKNNVYVVGKMKDLQ
jgi:hypothetical protein